MEIGNWRSDSSQVFVIAEIGNNHNGSLDAAIELVDAAKRSGANCVKFQMRHLDSVYRTRSLQKSGDDLGTEYVLDLLSRTELSPEEHKDVFSYCKENAITYMCTPWDVKSFMLLEEFGVAAYKIASADLTNLPLIDVVCGSRKPIILSTGMSTFDEIRLTRDFLTQRDVEFALLHCNSTYPAPLQDINLRWMDELAVLSPIYGYSGHERGIAVSLAAVARGAKIIERHFTFDRMAEGPDHAASLTPSEFQDLVKGIGEIGLAMGERGERKVSQGEMINRENLSKSLVASRFIRKGELIRSEDISVKSPGQGLSPQKIEELIGTTATRDINAEDYFYDTDLTGEVPKPRRYRFERPWGVPVRHHDFEAYNSISSPDLYEFHLSFMDLELKAKDFITEKSGKEFVVHAPELFANSHLMDLSSPDEEYRTHSIKETQRVIEVTRDLNRFFPNTNRPKIVANIGGFSMDAPLSEDEKQKRYMNFERSLKKLDTSEVEIIPQTMAPFPWHFGGQRFQNLFVSADDCLAWCNALGLRMCLDVSHSKLSCNHFGWDFDDFLRDVSTVTAHVHVGDASGVNGEGLQIGDGEIDFSALSDRLAEGCPTASFIPEIWQGHKNNGQGFWVALDRLEDVFK